jgi:hypothetical protein
MPYPDGGLPSDGRGSRHSPTPDEGDPDLVVWPVCNELSKSEVAFCSGSPGGQNPYRAFRATAPKDSRLTVPDA